MKTDFVLLAPGASKVAWKWCSSLGHEVREPFPSLFTLNLAASRDGGWLSGLSGLTVKHVQVWLKADRATEASPSGGMDGWSSPREGPLLFTHSGVSGPAILRLSAFEAIALARSKYTGLLRISFCPGVASDTVFAALASARDLLSRKLVKTLCPVTREGRVRSPSERSQTTDPDHEDLGSVVQRRLWLALVLRAGVREDDTWNDMDDPTLDKLAKLLTSCEVNVTGKGIFKDEFVTCGGVALRDVDLQTMESQRSPGLFFAGEVLNIDGITGGYNFQNCWTTGWLAGQGIAARTQAKGMEQPELSGVA